MTAPVFHAANTPSVDNIVSAVLVVVFLVIVYWRVILMVLGKEIDMPESVDVVTRVEYEGTLVTLVKKGRRTSTIRTPFGFLEQVQTKKLKPVSDADRKRFKAARVEDF
jgi:hypothetical protein